MTGRTGAGCEQSVAGLCGGGSSEAFPAPNPIPRSAHRGCSRELNSLPRGHKSLELAPQAGEGFGAPAYRGGRAESLGFAPTAPFPLCFGHLFLGPCGPSLLLPVSPLSSLLSQARPKRPGTAARRLCGRCLRSHPETVSENPWLQPWQPPGS